MEAGRDETLHTVSRATEDPVLPIVSGTWLRARHLLLASCAAFACCGAGAIAASAAIAPPLLLPSPDPTATGSYQVAEGEYRLPAAVDPLVDPSVVTEVWAEIYRPVDTTATAHPLLVLLHGNHATCGHYVTGRIGRVDDNSQYTTTGTCPDGYVVVPNHLGYAYFATRLASLGYVVVSINANRGINAGAGVTGDRGLNLRRGRLVLRHLQLLAQWNRDGGAPASLGFDLKGAIDFGHVGLFGHSRGGEGVLAAYSFYNDPGSDWPGLIGTPVRFEAMFELAPVDGQTSRTFVANNIPWTVLLPACDGDVSDLEGMKVYDRTLESYSETVPSRKSIYTVWGANHDFFNTEWQTSDSSGCSGAGNAQIFDLPAAGSAAQQTASTYAVMGMFRAYVGADAKPYWAALLDPAFGLPAPLAAVTGFERAHSDSATIGPDLSLDDFNDASGVSTAGFPDAISGATVSFTAVPNHDVTLQAAQVSWDRSGSGASSPAPYAQVNFAASGNGYDLLSSYKTLEFRIAQHCVAATGVTYACAAPDPLNAGLPTDLSMAFVRPDGSLTRSLPLSAFATVLPPVGGYGQNLHPILQTVRLPGVLFADYPGEMVRGVRFTFDRTPSGAIWVTNVRVSQQLDALLPFHSGGGGIALAADKVSPARMPAAAARSGLAGGGVTAIRQALPAGATAAAGGDVEIEVASAGAIPVRDSLLTLDVGGVELTQSRFATDGTTRHAIFTLSRAEFDSLRNGAAVTLVDGGESSRFGSLDKSLMQ